MTIIYDKIALIGLGLIASSVIHASKRAGVAGVIAGSDQDPAVLETARDMGLCDQLSADPAEAVQDADLVILAVPVGSMAMVAQQIGPHLKQGAVLSDVGSVKQSVIAQLTPHIPDHVTLVPAHPIAGTEESGPHAGFAELFDDRWCLLTPSDPEAAEVLRLAEFWQALGAKTAFHDPAHHDQVLAVTSHIPHLIAYTMVGVADDLQRVTEREVIDYSAAGFRDFTRIAASDPTMWRDVFLHNKEATLDILGRFTEELFALQRAIRMGEGEQLYDYFTRTRAIRRSIVAAGQDIDMPNFGRGKKDAGK